MSPRTTGIQAPRDTRQSHEKEVDSSPPLDQSFFITPQNDFWSLLNHSSVIEPSPQLRPEATKLTTDLIPTSKTTETSKQETEHQKAPPPSFFLGNGGLGINLTASAALVATGYLFGMANPAAFIAGGLLWWGLERATAPFFKTEYTNALNLSYRVLNFGSNSLKGLATSMMSKTDEKGTKVTALGHATLSGEAFGLRSAAALGCYIVGASGAFGLASMPFCALAGAIMFRASKLAIKSFISEKA